jgi:hypothetical protein
MIETNDDARLGFSRWCGPGSTPERSLSRYRIQLGNEKKKGAPEAPAILVPRPCLPDQITMGCAGSIPTAELALPPGQGKEKQSGRTRDRFAPEGASSWRWRGMSSDRAKKIVLKTNAWAVLEVFEA